ncbi:TolC family protein [Clostridium aciditolerans]|uniref:TolC family protein n=1 Tax=Clostridium aciditolerans TaxID=339861 RepID=A0A934HX39_9CLOT|nr:TolC family protein [Clostridium aciditolerans]MBI6873619.1 TolC family protein [Clostridium aciditolerans]
MKKKIGFLIAMAITLNVTTTCFADAAPAQSNVVNLTLEQAIGNVENNNEELKNIDTKIEAANRQYDWDSQQSLYISQNNNESQYGPGKYLNAVIQRDLTPLTDKKSIDDIKNTKSERLNTIKFDLEKKYLQVITYQQQIDALNKCIVDIDQQMNQIQEKINVGQATKDQLNPLKVKRNTLVSSISGLQAYMQTPLFTIKKYLNIDMNSELKLSAAKKDFAKFDDSDIENKIITAVKNDYSYGSLQKDINLSKQRLDITTKYVYDSVTEPMNTELSLKDLQNKSADTYTATEVKLWNSYYNLKNKEDAVQTQNTALEVAQMSYDKAKQSFDNGLIDKVTLDFAEYNLDNQKVTTQDAINDYMVSKEQFEYMLNGHASSGSIN